MLVDLHTHLDPSSFDARTLSERADALGVEGIAFVGDGVLPDLSGLDGAEPALFVGAEVETDRGHYLVFFPDPAAIESLEAVFGERDDGVWPVRDVVARTHALGGAVVAAHPYDPTVPHPGGDILFTLPSIQAVESVNPKHSAASPNAAIEAAETLGLPCVGGSDARSLDELGRAGTLFTRRLATCAELVAALRSGACWPVEFGNAPEHLLRKGPQPRSSEPREGDPRRRRRRRRS